MIFACEVYVKGAHFFQPKVEQGVFQKVLGLGLDWRVHDFREQR